MPQRRGVEIGLWVLIGILADQVSGNIPLRVRVAPEIILPMPEKIIDTANSDQCLDVSRGRNRSIVGCSAEGGRVASERSQRGQMRPGGCSEKADTRWIDRQLGCRTAKET